MAIVDIEAGSKASSQLLNDNFHYLQDLVGELSIKIDGSEATVDSKIATSRNSLQNEISTLETKLDKALPIGSVIAWSSKAIPTGWIAMVGQSIAQYTKLKEAIGKDTLPDTRNRVLWGNNTPLNLIEAGLPNIKGTFNADGYRSAPTGAFVTTKTHVGEDGTGTGATYEFNASKSNAIYGKSTTVQPPAVTVVWIIKYE